MDNKQADILQMSGSRQMMKEHRFFQIKSRRKIFYKKVLADSAVIIDGENTKEGWD